MVALDAYTDNPGTWLFHCHLNDHIHGGMMALFNVAGTAPTHNLNGKVRGHSIASLRLTLGPRPRAGVVAALISDTGSIDLTGGVAAASCVCLWWLSPWASDWLY
jgi:hypothetical protein